MDAASRLRYPTGQRNDQRNEGYWNFDIHLAKDFNLRGGVQLQLSAGRSLMDLGLGRADVPAPRGFAVQARINMETMDPDGGARPSGGTLRAFEIPSGPGLRSLDSLRPGWHQQGRTGSTRAPRAAITRPL